MFSPMLRRSLLGTALALLALFGYFFTQTLREPRTARLNQPFQYNIKSRNEMRSDIQRWREESQILKIVGLVFYGRRQQASILDCYLKRNLAKNGGLLDEVIWLQRTHDRADLAFLDRLINSEPDYKRVKVKITEKAFASAYDTIEDDILYIKVDTDIVFIEDTTIMSMVHTRATRPDYFLVGANIINQPLSSWLHWGLGAIHPYLPENKTFYPENSDRHGPQVVNWRASLLPKWTGPDDFNVTEWSPPEGRKHRWLPVSHGNHHVLDKTPIASTTYSAFTSSGWWNWAVGAQQHYSFFQNMERDELWRYRFHTWDYQDLRMGIQLIAITGRDINAVKPIGQDDEDYFAVKMPRKLGRLVVAAGGGVAAHFSFDEQKVGMAKTDILDRYRSYAQEHVCKGRMLWTSEEDDDVQYLQP